MTDKQDRTPKTARKRSPAATEAQRRYRERQKGAGLVSLQLSVSPVERDHLMACLAAYRLRPLTAQLTGKDYDDMDHQPWTAQRLFDALSGHSYAHDRGIQFQMRNGGDPMIEAELPHYGDLPVQIVVTESEIRASSVLCSASHVANTAAFNEMCLRLNLTFPLLDFGLLDVSGEPTYVVFGQLSTHSSIANIVEELETLGHNTILAAHEIQPFLA